MMSNGFSIAIQNKFEIYEWNNATTILENNYPNEWVDLKALLDNIKIPKSWIIKGGGGKSKIAKWVDNFLTGCQWDREIEFDFMSTNNKPCKTHKFDSCKNNVIFELEWNNKDPFFDRDLIDFGCLFSLNKLGVGIILTRSKSFQKTFKSLGIGSSYGASTTQTSKIINKVDKFNFIYTNVPILILGITDKIYDPNA